MEVKPGYKQTEVGVIPSDWRTERLGGVTDFLDHRRKPVEESLRRRMAGDIPYYGASGIVDYVNDYLFDDDLILLGEDGENILSRNTRLAFRVSGKVWVNNHAHVIKPRAGVDLRFLCEYLEALDYAPLNTGTAQPKLNKAVCQSLPIPLPPLREQEAIAEALSDADALIESMEKLIEKKRAIKQGAMQELLTGKRRLPGFTGKWEEKRLGEVLKIRPSYGINAPAVPFSDLLPRYIRITDIDSFGRFRSSAPVSVDHRESAEFFLQKGDIVFARTGASVGKSYRYSLQDGPLVFAGFLIRVRTDPALLLPDFLFESVQMHGYWNWVRLMSMRSGQPGINGREYAEFQMRIPSIDEQNVIVEALRSMNHQIEVLEEKTQKMRTVKQGMMQELLTGRVRLV